MNPSSRLHSYWHRSMADIDREQWDRLALPLQTCLLEWQWLYDLEASGSIAAAKGWHPFHLTVWKDESLVGAAPLYIKTHSEGEFIFDHWWARLARNLGIVYYPKLIGMSPVTPAVGYRFLIDASADGSAVQQTMFAAIDHFCRQMGLSGCHLHFVDPHWQATLPDGHMIAWQHQSYLWRNYDYAAFDAFLQRFKSSQRRNIKREMKRIKTWGIDIQALSDDQIPPEMATLMYRYYLNTNAQYGPWAARYLNADFFDRIFGDYRHRLLLMAAYAQNRSDTPVALSLLLHKNRKLIGRYWGCQKPIKDLHFNMCFYAPIEWAIANGIEQFDPGAGSPHKIYRGFEAVANTSLHRFYNPKLRALFLRFINGINEVEKANINTLNEHLPFAATDEKARLLSRS